MSDIVNRFDDMFGKDKNNSKKRTAAEPWEFTWDPESGTGWGEGGGYVVLSKENPGQKEYQLYMSYKYNRKSGTRTPIPFKSEQEAQDFIKRMYEVTTRGLVGPIEEQEGEWLVIPAGELNNYDFMW